LTIDSATRLGREDVSKNLSPKKGELSRAMRKDLGGWLKQQREREGKTMLEVAKACGIAYYSYIGSIENGAAPVNSEHYVAYAKVLNIDVKELVKRCLKAYDPVGWDILFGTGLGKVQLPRR
jgi:DNA-binding XRE family transcriptional regulator